MKYVIKMLLMLLITRGYKGKKDTGTKGVQISYSEVRNKEMLWIAVIITSSGKEFVCWRSYKTLND